MLPFAEPWDEKANGRDGVDFKEFEFEQLHQSSCPLENRRIGFYHNYIFKFGIILQYSTMLYCPARLQ